MNPELRRILEAADDAVGTAGPVDTSCSGYEADEDDIQYVLAAIRQHHGIEFERDGNVQDASFFEELYVLTSEARQARDEGGGYAHLVEIGIRFSNFDKLFTVYSHLDSIPDRYDLASIIGLVSDRGWQYVPAEPLEVPYDGVNEVLRRSGIMWWHRFFDYL